jgi:hypothetical protein
VGIWIASGRDVAELAGRPADPRSCGTPEQVLSAATAETMLPILHAWSRAHDWPAPPALEIASQACAAAARGLYETAAPALRALRTAGVETLLIKGGALDRAAYPDDLPRATGDLDLLIAAAKTDAGSRALRGVGFEQGRPDPERLRIVPLSDAERECTAAQGVHLPPFFRIVHLPDLTPLAEPIHRYLAGGPLVVVGGEIYLTVEIDLHFNHPLGLDPPDLCDDGETHHLPTGDEVRVQAASDQVWWVAERLYREVIAFGNPALRRFVDLLVLLASRGGDVDWDRVLRMAVKHELQPPLFYTLWHAAELLPATVPAEILEACRPGRAGVARRRDWGDFLPKLLGGLSVVPLAPRR